MPKAPWKKPLKVPKLLLMPLLKVLKLLLTPLAKPLLLLLTLLLLLLNNFGYFLKSKGAWLARATPFSVPASGNRQIVLKFRRSNCFRFCWIGHIWLQSLKAPFLDQNKRLQWIVQAQYPAELS